ncbi:Hsp20/alpha crystallin family protein [Geobacter anodireducens]|jgi:HSP20 family molecular chaperone IbpA|uniref:Hsp20/alpha crystallin family protein n=1 Tax=Geobacter anodireducens TaxID=1340425 RepID=A0ABR9NZN1_9BACT|nr:Hsp20/alpha crystallin family protein [Geobacter anodireducens]MBE2889735.1 Hsp20/alpha crystallin family protein [Geobacter anodireducens]
MAANSLTERNDERSVQTREETRSNEKYIRPAVNIIETEEGLVLTADIPGASKDALDVNVEKGILTISAPAQHTMPGTSAYREFELANYYRQFTIPESLDHEKAHADYVNGILTLRIPKAEIAKPKRIAVQVG